MFILDKVKENKYKVIIIILIISLIILIPICNLLNKREGNKKLSDDNVLVKNDIKIKSNVKEMIKVDIKGSVNNPGVYELEAGNRVVDVIFKAGGLKENSNTGTINLSKKLEDQMVVIIYTNEEIEQFKKGNVITEYVYVEKDCVCPDKINDACISQNENLEETSNIEKTSIENKLVSINNSTKEELMNLSGIGESKATAIIEYRNKIGSFNAIEQIKDVSGIGDSLFEKIKDSITI